MAISTTSIGVANTTAYLSSGDSAVTFLSLCNYSISAIICSINVVPSGGTVGDDNIIIQDIEILAGDTYILYQGGEKIILADGDYVSIISNTATALTSVASYMEV